MRATGFTGRHFARAAPRPATASSWFTVTATGFRNRRRGLFRPDGLRKLSSRCQRIRSFLTYYNKRATEPRHQPRGPVPKLGPAAVRKLGLLSRELTFSAACSTGTSLPPGLAMRYRRGTRTCPPGRPSRASGTWYLPGRGRLNPPLADIFAFMGCRSASVHLEPSPDHVRNGCPHRSGL